MEERASEEAMCGGRLIIRDRARRAPSSREANDVTRFPAHAVHTDGRKQGSGDGRGTDATAFPTLSISSRARARTCVRTGAVKPAEGLLVLGFAPFRKKPSLEAVANGAWWRRQGPAGAPMMGRQDSRELGICWQIRRRRRFRGYAMCVRSLAPGERR